MFLIIRVSSSSARKYGRGNIPLIAIIGKRREMKSVPRPIAFFSLAAKTLYFFSFLYYFLSEQIINP